ncbi:MAG: crossover junction endodeoxyribonuclease RuvC [Patescibacteria group bacterium]
MRTPSQTVTIFGVDPGVAITGYGVITRRGQAVHAVAYGAICSAARTPFGERLDRIHRELRQLLRKHQPDVVAVERLFFSKNVKTALAVGEARGVIMLSTWEQRCPVREFTPLQVKQALTGYGLATKQQVQRMVQQQLQLRERPHPDDVADALAIALCAAFTRIPTPL